MKKDIKFSTRMASEDREAIKELAKRSGMSMSDYVTACCLGKQVVVVDGLKEVLLYGANAPPRCAGLGSDARGRLHFAYFLPKR